MKNLNTWFVTGFCDGESCFYLKIRKNSKSKIGWSVELVFSINLHEKDQVLLEAIQNYFGGIGNITKHDKSSIQYKVSSINDIELIINHFEKYPLITQKWSDYQLWKMGFYLVKNKEHLTLEGINKLIAIKASINLGLSDSLKAAFPDIVAIKRPSVLDQTIKDPNWLSGFISGEGCFFIYIQESKTHKIKKSVSLIFSISQHIRDEKLLKSFLLFLECGRYSSCSNKKKGEFSVNKLTDNLKVIQFLKEHPIYGIKALDFNDFCEAAEIMKTGEHLMEEGFKKIMEIKARMNRNRIFNNDFS